MIKSIKLPPELAKKMVRRAGALSIKKSVATTMAAAGQAATTEGNRNFVESVATLNSNYRMLVYQATQEAIAAGYDPVNHGDLQISAERGVAYWEVLGEEPAGESEGDKNVDTQEGKA